MKRLLACLIVLALTIPLPAEAATSRLKDIVDVEGVRENQLIGYGLVVGLNGTGDSLTNSPFTQQSLIGMLERLGVNVRGDAPKTKNVAAVMVTATLPPFSTQGTRLDVNISALGDAKSLSGGTLLVTPLMGADSEVYAVAQGPLATSSYTSEGEGTSVTKGVPTAGRIAAGAIVEREITFSLSNMSTIRLALRNPDFTTARRVAEAINKRLALSAARASDPATVHLAIPLSRQGDVAGLLTDLEQIPINTDTPARIVIDEKAGIIVMGENVRVSTVAIAQGNLTIRITETPQVSQPNAFSQTGQTTTVARTDIDVNEQADNKMTVMNTGVSIQELVQNLNTLGVGPRDMIAILQAIKAAGALQAEIEVI